MTDNPEHGPDSLTPPEGSGSGKPREKSTRQRPRRKRARKATAKGRKSGRKTGKTPKRTGRRPVADVELMTTLVMERILLGERRRDILRHVANLIADKELRFPNPEGPSPRTIDNYIAKATEEIKKLSTVERSEAMAAARGRFMMIMKKAHDVGDLSTARLANRDLARIDGLEPVRVQHSGSVLQEVTHTGTVQHEHVHRPATLDEQAAAIRDLFGRAGARAIAAGDVKS